MATNKKVPKFKPGKGQQVCTDRPVSFLDISHKMFRSIEHNAANSPAKGKTPQAALVKRFMQDPHQPFTPKESADLSRLALITGNKW